MKLKGKELKKRLKEAVEECERLAEKSLKNYKPVNPSWETYEGAAYIRVSDDKQVAVEHGSLHQQINIANVSATRLSHKHQCNFKIVQYYIEPGLSGKNEDREKLIKLFIETKKKAYKFIIIKEISRLIRDTKTFLSMLDELKNIRNAHEKDLPQSCCTVVVKQLICTNY